MTKRTPDKTGRKQRRALAPAKDSRPDPTELEQRLIVKTARAFLVNHTEPPGIAAHIDDGTLRMSSPHNNDVGWSISLVGALGLSGGVIASVIQGDLLNMRGADTPKTQDEADAAAYMVREGMAFVQALNPTNAQEAILCVQMWATHCATMKLSRLLHRADMLPQFTAYGQLLNKSQRTFAAQNETLQKLRTGGKQQVEVRYVYVDARTQTVVTGGGGQPGTLPQPHARLGHAPGVPLWGEDAGGDAMPVASHQEPEAMPDARGQESGRSEGGSQRGVRPRPEKRRDKAA